MTRCTKEFEDEIYDAMSKENIDCRIGVYCMNDGSLYIELSKAKSVEIKTANIPVEWVRSIGHFTTESRNIDSIVKGIKKLIIIDDMRR